MLRLFVFVVCFVSLHVCDGVCVGFNAVVVWFCLLLSVFKYGVR